MMTGGFALFLTNVFYACNGEKREQTENKDSVSVKGEAPKQTEKDGVLVEDTSVKKMPVAPVEKVR